MPALHITTPASRETANTSQASRDKELNEQLRQASKYLSAPPIEQPRPGSSNRRPNAHLPQLNQFETQVPLQPSIHPQSATNQMTSHQQL